jgi:DNA-binding PadR family transcriptional regulator
MNPSLGEFEQMVLLAILRLGDDAYGVEVLEEIRRCTGRETAPGAMYTTLGRLEDKGVIEGRLGEPTAERGGRAKRYFKVTSAGRTALVDAQLAYRKLMAGLDLLETDATGGTKAYDRYGLS